MASWGTPWMSFVSCVIVLRMLSLTVCGDTVGTSSNLELSSAKHCPDPEVIAPCKCTYHVIYGMDMDCSNVTSEDELRSVFSNDFAFIHFRLLNINKCLNITSLRKGDLGSASFTEIHITFTSLSEIEDDALEGSFQTLIYLAIYYNSLKSVPDISAFTRLNYLHAWGNQLTMFPNISSTTLLRLDLDQNHIDDVPVDALIGLPLLEDLSLSETRLTEIQSHTFTRNENLNRLDLAINRLITIPDDAITLHGQATTLRLDSNQITNLTYEAISSVNGKFWINYNNLTEVSEKVFRPLLEDSVNVTLWANPFNCGCDIAWLVFNQTLLKRLDDLDRTYCNNGQKFIDLDPEVYKVMCPNATAVPP